MAHLIPSTKQSRRGTLYSRAEIAVISKYKAEYKDQTTRALRANVLQHKILVDLFNYWDVQKTLPSNEAVCYERMKVNDNMVKLERLDNLSHCLGTCCLGAK
jgi:hypothetical protein